MIADGAPPDRPTSREASGLESVPDQKGGSPIWAGRSPWVVVGFSRFVERLLTPCVALVNVLGVGFGVLPPETGGSSWSPADAGSASSSLAGQEGASIPISRSAVCSTRKIQDR